MAREAPVGTSAAIDLGSNSLKWVVGKGQRVLLDRAVITRIGEGVERAGALSRVAIDRTMLALSEAIDGARALGATQLAGVATAGLRGARDGEAFVRRVADELGVRLEIIDGRREAELAYRCPAERYAEGPSVVLLAGARIPK